MDAAFDCSPSRTIMRLPVVRPALSANTARRTPPQASYSNTASISNWLIFNGSGDSVSDVAAQFVEQYAGKKALFCKTANYVVQIILVTGYSGSLRRDGRHNQTPARGQGVPAS
ncbi:MAG: hypothetical protein OXQ89_05285 [Rhodospirillaceae bacterium]|nr:hypothetical protein [Rhodospirillaceae bacterium]MDD9997139.1 hypothetical protein [Rhodospirillaceae bacterium]MDE0360546.1 hypothetical protein [Rhodospirillaceae bacterium]